MANRKGLGVSKKYANGTVHETATGRFVVLDRFADEDDEKNIPMLEFQWLSGEREGKVETNREMNMAASIHKFQTSRGKPTVWTESKMIDEEITFVEKIDLTFELCKKLEQHVEQDDLKMDRITQTLEEVYGIKTYIDKAAESVKDNSNNVGSMMKSVFENVVSNTKQLEETILKVDSIFKVIEEQQATIKQLTEKLSELLQHSTTVAKQQDVITSQQSVMDKLLQKI